MQKILIASALAAFALSAEADEMYGGLGTLGLNIGYAKAIGDGTARIDLNGYTFSKTQTANNVTYDVKLKLLSVAALYDYFPMQGGFRLTGGVLLGDNKISGSARPTGGNYTLNGVTYAAAGESLALSVKMPSVMPYLGIGWGHQQTSKGLGFFADAGVALGKPKVSLTASPTLATAAGADLDAERQKAQQSLDKLKVFPVIKLGLRYNF